MSCELASVTFPHADGAERAYGRLRARSPGAAWLDKVVFVESHRHDRIVVRGTFAGRYLDVGDDTAIGERDVEIGTVAGGIVGFAFGPAGFAVGLIVGGAAGARAGASDSGGGLVFDEVRALVPVGSSALVLYGEPDDADALEQAFADTDAAVVRHRLTAEEDAALIAAVASAPPAASPHAGAD